MLIGTVSATENNMKYFEIDANFRIASENTKAAEVLLSKLQKKLATLEDKSTELRNLRWSTLKEEK